MELDFITDWSKLPTFDIIFDRGVFHTMLNDEKRNQFAEHIADVCQPNGLWLNITASSDHLDQIIEGVDIYPPPAITATDLISGVEKKFEVIEMRRCFYPVNDNTGKKIKFHGWASVFKKR